MPNKEEIIPADELIRARYRVKRELEANHLPYLPDYVETELFLEGRTAWTYKYSNLNVENRRKSKRITFNIQALIKKEFHELADRHRFNFRATCFYYPYTKKLKVLEILSVERL